MNAIEKDDNDYTNEFKADVDSRYEEYKNGGLLISEEEANKRINSFLSSSTKIPSYPSGSRA